MTIRPSTAARGFAAGSQQVRPASLPPPGTPAPVSPSRSVPAEATADIPTIAGTKKTNGERGRRHGYAADPAPPADGAGGQRSGDHRATSSPSVSTYSRASASNSIDHRWG